MPIKIGWEISSLCETESVKILINSIYGYFGNKYAPLGDPDIARSITLTGQAVIKQSNKDRETSSTKYKYLVNVNISVIYWYLEE